MRKLSVIPALVLISLCSSAAFASDPLYYAEWTNEWINYKTFDQDAEGNYFMYLDNSSNKSTIRFSLSKNPLANGKFDAEIKAKRRNIGFYTRGYDEAESTEIGTTYTNSPTVDFRYGTAAVNNPVYPDMWLIIDKDCTTMRVSREKPTLAYPLKVAVNPTVQQLYNPNSSTYRAFAIEVGGLSSVDGWFASCDLKYRKTGETEWSTKTFSSTPLYIPAELGTYEVEGSITLTENYTDQNGNKTVTFSASNVQVTAPGLAFSTYATLKTLDNNAEPFTYELEDGFATHKGADDTHPAKYSRAVYAEAELTIFPYWTWGTVKDTFGVTTEYVVTSDYDQTGISAVNKSKLMYVPINADCKFNIPLKVAATFKRDGKVVGTLETTTTLNTDRTKALTIEPNVQFFSTDATPVNLGTDPDDDNQTNYGLLFEFQPLSADLTAEKYPAYSGFEVTGDYRTDAAAAAIAPEIAPYKEGIYNNGCEGYEPYDGQTWTDANDWASKIKSSKFGILLSNVDRKAKTDNSDIELSGKEVSINFYNYIPVVVATDRLILAETPASVTSRAGDDNLKIRLLQSSSKSTEPITLSNYSLTNGGVITGIDTITIEDDVNAPVDVYSVSGALVLRATTKDEAMRTLAPGFYIIGHEKVAVK